MPPASVTIRVPATSANLGPGFDSMGVALDWTGLITISTSYEPAAAPDDPVERMAVVAASAVFEAAGEPVEGLSARYEGDMPVGRGLGVSAAARVGGVVGANALLGNRATLEDLAPIATRLEGHAGDNVMPAMFGGLQVVVDDDGESKHLKIEPPDDLRLALLVPEFNMPTHESRKRLPASLTRNQAVHNIGRAAMVIGAITTGRYELLGTASADVIHQPARGGLFPAMYPIFAAARAAGAYGVYLSGGGSTIAAWVSPERGEDVAGAMREAAAAHGLSAVARVATLSSRGAEVVEA